MAARMYVCEGECDTRCILGKTTRGRQRGTSGALVWRFDLYVCSVCVCTRVPRYTHARSCHWALGRGVCVYPCCVFTTCPCCAHIDPAVRLRSHIVFYHFSPPGSSYVNTPAPNTVRRGLAAASALSDAFMTMRGHQETPALCEPNVFLFGWWWWLFIPWEHRRCWKIKLYWTCTSWHYTFLFHRELLVFAKSRAHFTDTRVHKLNHPFCCLTVVCYSLT